MSSSTVINEDVLAKVVEISKRGKEGTYKQKVVQVNGKDHVVSKDDKDKVEVGKEYHFKLTKSEFNDKLYYWAGLIKDKSQDQNKTPSAPFGDEFKKQAFAWLDSLDTEKKKQVIKYLLDRI